MEQKLEEAIKDFELGKSYSVKKVRESLSEKMELIYNLKYSKATAKDLERLWKCKYHNEFPNRDR